MNKHQVEGRAEDAKGKLKEAAGHVVGNDRMKVEGKLDQASGRSQAAAGDALEKTRKAVSPKR